MVRSLEGLTIRTALFIGFGLTLGVWLFTGYYFTRRLSAVELDAAAVRERYMHAQDVLSGVSARVLLSSVYLRDALLDPDPGAVAGHRRRLEETYNDLAAELERYVPVLDTRGEREHVARLRQEIDAFRVTTREALGDGSRTPRQTRELLNTRIVPRRESVIRVTEAVRGLNRASFIEQQRVIAALHGAAQQQTWRWLGAALAVSLGIGLLASAYSARLEQRLRRQREIEVQTTRNLQLLSTKLITAQEEERQRIARELHDEVGQVLTALKVELAVAQRRIASGDAAEALEDAQAIAATALQSVRDLSQGLHPALLDDIGLAAAVDWYLQTFTKRYGIRTDLRLEAMNPRLAPEVELAAYRAVQEALSNAARHAHARNCRVVLRRVAGAVQVIVEDDGCGFDADAVPPGSRRGLGLLGMRERAGQLNGSLRIESTPGAGTRIKVTLPDRPTRAATEIECLRVPGVPIVSDGA